MIKKVYIASSEEDLVYEVSNFFPSIRHLNCNTITEQEFLKLHSPNLFSNKLLFFYNVNTFNDEFLLSIIQNLKVDVVWGFNSLPKNRKLYKKLNSISNISEVSGIESVKDKKLFLSGLFKDNNIPTKYMDFFLQNSSDSKLLINSEIQKLKYVLLNLKDKNIAEKCLCAFNSTSDVFEFINNLFENNIEKSYIFADKISNASHSLLLGALLSKKIKSMIFLSIGNINEANRFWRYGNYYLTKAIAGSKKIGFSNLVNILEYVDKEFNDTFNQKDLFLKLNQLIYIVNNSNIA